MHKLIHICILNVEHLYKLPLPCPSVRHSCRIRTNRRTKQSLSVVLRLRTRATKLKSRAMQSPKPKQVFVLQKFCGNSAKLLRKSFVNSNGIANFCFGKLKLFKKKNTEKINFTNKQYFCCIRHRLNYCFAKLLVK